MVPNLPMHIDRYIFVFVNHIDHKLEFRFVQKYKSLADKPPSHSMCTHLYKCESEFDTLRMTDPVFHQVRTGSLNFGTLPSFPIDRCYCKFALWFGHKYHSFRFVPH